MENKITFKQHPDYEWDLIYKWIWILKPKTLNQWLNLFEWEVNYKKGIETLYYAFKTFKIEERAFLFLEKVYKWKVWKADINLDKYHQVDLIAENKQKQLCYFQVKTKTYQNTKLDKLVKISIKDNAIPYLIIVNKNKLILKKLRY